MRFIKILLVLVFAVTAVLYTMNDLRNTLSDTDEGPVLTCSEQTLSVSVSGGRQALMQGITAEDAQDGDLTDRILISGISNIISDNNARVTYVVFDNDDNMATCTRNIRYTDYVPPRFSLDTALCYSASESISLLDRLHAYDAIDGDITRNIRVSYSNETDDSRIYTIDAQVTNSVGHTITLTLPMVVYQNSDLRPVVELETYLVYLEKGSELDPDSYISRATYNGDQLGTGNVKISGEVDTDTPGTYTLTYCAAYNGTEGLAVLTVVVE